MGVYGVIMVWGYYSWKLPFPSPADRQRDVTDSGLEKKKGDRAAFIRSLGDVSFCVPSADNPIWTRSLGDYVTECGRTCN